MRLGCAMNSSRYAARSLTPNDLADLPKYDCELYCIVMHLTDSMIQPHRRRSTDGALEHPAQKVANNRLGVLKDMILFVEVARQKNFSEAAKALDIPLSTLARRISRLERELGVLLIERTTRQQRLTVEGRDYFERCRHIVDDAMSTYDALHAKVHGLSGTIRLTVCELSGAFLLECVKAFVDANPHLSIDVSGEGALDESDRDLMIKVGVPERHSLTARKLGVMPVGLFAAPDYLSGHPAIDTRSHLKGHEIVVPQSFLDHCDPYFQEILTSRIDLGSRLTFASFSSLIVPLISRRSGIGALPVNIAEPFVATGHLRAILPNWRPISLPVFAIMKDRRLPARTRAFLTFLTKGVHSALGSGPLPVADLPKHLRTDESDRHWQAA